MTKILMVCLGNICRSPMAEGILKQKLAQRNLNHVEVDSAGFEPFHAGEPPDKRAMATMRKHGIDISEARARLFSSDDFDRFDKIYVMDNHNFRDVMKVARDDDDRKKVDFLLNKTSPGSNSAVPDPYYGGDEGFDLVYQMISNACEGIIDELDYQK